MPLEKNLEAFDRKRLPRNVDAKLSVLLEGSFLDRETARLGALVAKVRERIERLKEYRVALISAAVTGKIYLRKSARKPLCIRTAVVYNRR